MNPCNSFEILAGSKLSDYAQEEYERTVCSLSFRIIDHSLIAVAIATLSLIALPYLATVALTLIFTATYIFAASQCPQYRTAMRIRELTELAKKITPQNLDCLLNQTERSLALGSYNLSASAFYTSYLTDLKKEASLLHFFAHITEFSDQATFQQKLTPELAASSYHWLIKNRQHVSWENRRYWILDGSRVVFIQNS